MKTTTLLLLSLLLFAGCASAPHPTVAQVDLPRFMGDWYVVGILPNPIEKNARNGIESYTLQDDGTIAISYIFADNRHPEKITALAPRARVKDTQSNSRWEVQFFKPFWFPYLIIDLAEDYRYTVIGVPNRKYLWIMSRTSTIAPEDWDGIIGRLKVLGYKTHKIMPMPQVWE